jgi:hypothetical protein
MAESSRSTAVGQAELGALLALLHGADAGFRSVEATWRVWRHEERLRQAFAADADEQKRRGASISTLRIGNGDSEAPENEEMVRIWREGERFRGEHHGGRRDGYYAVADGQFWWMWDERTGARSNQDDPSVGSGVGHELEVMLNPTPLLGSLRFRATGSSDVAGDPPSRRTPRLGPRTPASPSATRHSVICGTRSSPASPARSQPWEPTSVRRSSSTSS